MNHVPDTPTTWWRTAWAAATQGWFAPLAVLVGLFNLLTSAAVVADREGTMPGRVIGPALMTGLAAALFSGLWMRVTARKVSRSSRMPVAAETASESEAGARVSRRQMITRAVPVVLVLCSAAFLVVGATSAGAVVLLGTIAVGGTLALVSQLRRPRHASARPAPGLGLANSLILVGTIPALAFFWIVVPPLLALAVIVGVLTSDRRMAAVPISPAAR